MTTITELKSSTFVEIFSDRFANGRTDFGRMSAFFIRSIESLDEEIEKSAPDSKGYQILSLYKAINAAILNTAYKAQRHYLKNYTSGKIEEGFQSILGSLFGVMSPLGRATQMLMSIAANSIPLPASNKQEYDQLTAAILSISEAEMARFIAKEENETLWFSPGENSLQPSRILIAKPDGKVYEIRSNLLKSAGGSRSFYKALLYDGSCKVVGGLTNISSTEEAFFINDDIERLQTTKDGMKNEYSLLEDLRKTPGIIKIYDHFSLSIAGRPVGFSMMRFNRMDLIDYMNDIYKDPTGCQLSPIQKINFMISLATILTELHAKGLIHRDIKSDNFVVKLDKSGNTIPIAIDFTSCISKDDTEQKSEWGGTTILWWPPEYITAYLRGGNMTDATTQKMDTWALGLVFFQFYYGQSLMDLLSKTGLVLNKGQKALVSSLAEAQNNFPIFKLEMGSKSNKYMNDNRKSIWEKIQENPAIWTQVILPMLSNNPADRPPMKDSVDKLKRALKHEEAKKAAEKLKETKAQSEDLEPNGPYYY